MSNTKAIEILEKMIWSVKSPSGGYDDPYDEGYEKGIVDGKMYALEDAKERIEALTDEWISVSEKIPDDSHGYVICYVKYLNSLGQSQYIDILNCNSNGVWSDGEENYIVTHWMPLPNIPIINK